jgi:hypothetical protein
MVNPHGDEVPAKMRVVSELTVIEFALLALSPGLETLLRFGSMLPIPVTHQGDADHSNPPSLRGNMKPRDVSTLLLDKR